MMVVSIFRSSKIWIIGAVLVSAFLLTLLIVFHPSGFGVALPGARREMSVVLNMFPFVGGAAVLFGALLAPHFGRPGARGVGLSLLAGAVAFFGGAFLAGVSFGCYVAFVETIFGVSRTRLVESWTTPFVVGGYAVGVLLKTIALAPYVALAPIACSLGVHCVGRWRYRRAHA
ncbi:MAG: hypothetical protein MRY74_08970 [Neomegalonema sp.]|nr:hypothetical protein [Neomegalonema sp.]